MKQKLRWLIEKELTYSPYGYIVSFDPFYTTTFASCHIVLTPNETLDIF